MAVLIFGILRGVCLAGSVVDVRSVVGFASAGGAGQVWWVVSGGAAGRSASAAVRRAGTQLAAGHKKRAGAIASAITPAQPKMAATYSPTFAVPSAQLGLTSLFGMGRGGTPTL